MASTGSKNSAAWGSRPAELNWVPRPPAIRVRGVCAVAAPPFYTSSTESKLHSGTLLGLPESPGGAQTQRLSKLAAFCLASDGLHLESPALLKFAGSSRTHTNHVGGAMKLPAATRVMMLQVLTSDLLPLDAVLTWNIPKNMADPAS